MADSYNFKFKMDRHVGYSIDRSLGAQHSRHSVLEQVKDSMPGEENASFLLDRCGLFEVHL